MNQSCNLCFMWRCCPTPSPPTTHSKWKSLSWGHERRELVLLLSCCSTGENKPTFATTVELALDIRIASEVHKEVSTGELVLPFLFWEAVLPFVVRMTGKKGGSRVMRMGEWPC